MNCQLANFVHLRLFRFQIGALKKGKENGRSILTGSATTVAAGSEAQMDNLIVLLDGLVESETAQARHLQAERGSLQKKFEGFSARLDTAIASHRLHGRCDLVSFF